MILLKVKSTSCAVNGCPLCHFTSLRRLNVHVRPSSECSQDSASAGSTSSVSHEVSVNPSNRYPRTPDDDASFATARLNVSGSLIVASVRAPPRFPEEYSNLSAFRTSCSTVAPSSSSSRAHPASTSRAMPTRIATAHQLRIRRYCKTVTPYSNMYLKGQRSASVSGILPKVEVM